ncbi:MAG: hypothetical protein IT371_21915 [Deltaproteobacteria bacterium]|nr:hypothetical protein [Deltaproteobacteria bacterium]
MARLHAALIALPVWLMVGPSAANAVPAPATAPGPGAAAPATQGTAKKTYGKRSVVGLEIAPGVAIPFKKYLDFGGGNDTYTMENGVGAGFALCLTLNHWEFRWAYTSLSTGRVKGRIPDSAFSAIPEALRSGVKQVIDLEAQQSLILHHVGMGYRFTFEPTERFRIAIPVGFGMVVASPPDFGVVNYSLFGFGGQAGVLAEYTLFKVLALGADARFSMFVTEPDANLAAAGIAATQNVFDNAIAWLPMLFLGIHARVYY